VVKVQDQVSEFLQCSTNTHIPFPTAASQLLLYCNSLVEIFVSTITIWLAAQDPRRHLIGFVVVVLSVVLVCMLVVVVAGWCCKVVAINLH